MSAQDAILRDTSRAHTVVGAAFLLAAYWALDAVVMSGLRASVATYKSPLLLANALRESTVWIPLVTISAVPALAARQLGWSQLGMPRLRWVIVGIAASIAWAFSTYDFNHYLGHWHTADRIVVVALALGVTWHPAFVGPLLVIAIVVANQFAIPLGSYTWTDKRILFRVLGLFAVYLTIRPMWRVSPRVFVALMFTAHAASYLVPAWAKLGLPWLERNHLENLWMAFHTNGWLDHIHDDTAQSIAATIGHINKALLWGTMATEVSPLLLLASRRLAIAILAACMLMHVGIFASSGIFFWKWIVLDGLLIWLCLSNDLERGFFGWRSPYFFTSLLALCPVVWVMKPAALAWLDTRLNNMYELRVEGTSGQVYRLGRNQMSPFDVTFSQNRFSYLVPNRHFVMTGGATQDASLLDSLDALRDTRDVKAFQRKNGSHPLSSSKRETFAAFICRYFNNVEQHGAKRTFPRLLAAPKHIWSWRSTDAFDWREPVRSVFVRWISTWYDGSGVHTIEDKVVAHIVLKPGGATARHSVWTHACPP